MRTSHLEWNDSSMSDQEEILAVLFVDIVDSTKLYDRFGDDVAKKTISSGISLLSDIVEQYGGRMIKTIGDEVMATFPNGDVGVRAGMFMQQMMSESGLVGVAGALQIRVGVHCGPVIHENGDVFGNTVNVAARVIKQCKPGQVLASKAIIDAVDPDNPIDSRLIDKLTLKGIQELFELHEIILDDGGAQGGVTAMFSDEAMDLMKPVVSSMRFKFRDKEIVVGFEKRGASFGRSPENDVSVLNEAVSRLHAKIEYDRNKFTLIDQSINGTFVTFSDGRSITLKRDQLVLDGDGVMSLGRPVEPDSPLLIAFHKE